MKRLIPYIIALIIIVPLIAGYFLIKTKSESYKQSAIQACASSAKREIKWIDNFGYIV